MITKHILKPTFVNRIGIFWHTLSCPPQIRIVARLIEEDEAGTDSRLFDFLETMLRHKAEMVIYEAANAIVTLKRSSARELAPAISVLQLFLSNPKPTLR